MKSILLYQHLPVIRICQFLILVGLAFLCNPRNSFAQPAVLWDKTLGSLENDELIKVIQTSDGGMLVGASSESGVSVDKSQSGRGKFDFWAFVRSRSKSVQKGGGLTSIILKIRVTETAS